MKRTLLGSFSLLLAACATLPPAQQAAQNPGGSCRQLFAQLDDAVFAAGLEDAGDYRVPGFAWARSNRFLTSFAADLKPAQQADWLARLRQRDQTARALELANLASLDWPQDSLALLQHCGDVLLRQTLGDPLAMAALREAVAVPDDYSLLARAAGVYPLSMPFMRLGVLGYQKDVRERFAQPLPAVQGQWRWWQLPSQAMPRPPPIDWSQVPRDGLAVPALTSAQMDALFARHAPVFLLDHNGAYDQPGRPLAPMAKAEPAGFDASVPAVYLKLAWTRWGDTVLPQLVYNLWFSQRPPESALDPYAGKLDGLMWRVTLDPQGEPLMYDTVHACGCYHYHFPAQDRPRSRENSFTQEPLLLPQGQVPWSPLAIVLQSGTHYVLRVLPLPAARQLAEGQPATLTPIHYDALRSQTGADGQPRSLFGPDGLVAGSQRMERWWLWPSGVASPGAMRQWGRHATAFIGRAHFDDPYFLEHLGLMPPE